MFKASLDYLRMTIIMMIMILTTHKMTIRWSKYDVDDGDTKI